MSNNQWNGGTESQSSPHREEEVASQPSGSENWESATSAAWNEGQTENITQGWNQEQEGWNGDQSSPNAQDWNQQQGQNWNTQASAPDWNNQQPAQDWNTEQSQANIAQDWNQQQGQNWNTQPSAQDWGTEHSQANIAQDWNQQQGQNWNTQPSAQDWNQPGGTGWNQQGSQQPQQSQQWNQPQQGQWQQPSPSSGAFGALFDFKFTQNFLPSGMGLVYLLFVILSAITNLTGFVRVASSQYVTAMDVISALLAAIGSFLISIIVARVVLEVAKAIIDIRNSVKDADEEK